MVDALQWEHEVSLLSVVPVDLQEINLHFGTALSATRLQTHRVARAPMRWLRHVPLPLAQLRSALMMRAASRVAHRHDLVIGCHNEAWYGRPAIQYVHFPWAYLPRPATERRWYHGGDFTVRLYHGLCARASGFTWADMLRNLTLVNSEWTGRRFRARHGGSFQVLHPPVIGQPRPTPWTRREHGFICVGRFSPEKELEKVIRIVGAVRAQGHPVTLTLAGTADDPHYAEHIAARARAQGDWIRLEWNPDRDRLLELMGRHRFGIHGMREEHFGMAVAEMVASGCVVFVPDDGGQVEIVAHGPPLTYRDEADAVRDICRVLDEPAELRRLREHLATRVECFTQERFQQRFREIVCAWLVQQRSHRGQSVPPAAATPVPTRRRNPG